MTTNLKSSSNWTIDVNERVLVVEFSPFNWCGTLLAVATTKRITVAKCTLPDDGNETENLEYLPLREFNHGTRILALAWNPQTNLELIPRLIKFAASGADHKIRIYSSDLKNEDRENVLCGHSSYINDIAFEPEKGNRIASVSDDNTCRLWDLTGASIASFALKSAGMAVKWHPNEEGKLLVAEKSGLVRFYNILTQQPIMSLDCGRQPLMSVDWCVGNSLKVGCVASTDWAVWDTSRSSRPLDSECCHVEIARFFRWCPTNENLVATVGRPGNQVIVTHLRTKQICLSSQLSIMGNISWHYNLPIIAAGSDRKILFWLVEGY